MRVVKAIPIPINVDRDEAATQKNLKRGGSLKPGQRTAMSKLGDGRYGVWTLI